MLRGRSLSQNFRLPQSDSKFGAIVNSPDPSPRPPSSTPKLHYAPPIPLLVRLRNRYWLTVYGILVGLMLFPMWGPRVRQRAQEIYWQQQCLNHPIPPGSTVYSSGPPAAFAVSPQWSNFDAIIAPIGIRSSGTVYLGERTSHNGLRRLIAVDVLADQNQFLPPSQLSVTVAARAVEEGSPFSAPRETSTKTDGYGYMYNLHPLPIAVTPPSHPQVMVYGGADDSADRSHFTFCYDLASERVIYDCWLLDNGAVRLDRTTMPRPGAMPAPPQAR